MQVIYMLCGIQAAVNDASLKLVGMEDVRMCSVLEPGRTEWNGSIPRAWNGSDPVFGSEKFEERNGSIPVFGFGMG
jgi:hypothetical protein